jgi:hypothetical protein
MVSTRIKYKQFNNYLKKTEDRMTFARDELERIEDDPEHPPNLFFSDEAHFHLHGGVNQHNFRYWSDENPSWYSENPLHSP